MRVLYAIADVICEREWGERSAVAEARQA